MMKVNGLLILWVIWACTRLGLHSFFVVSVLILSRSHIGKLSWKCHGGVCTYDGSKRITNGAHYVTLQEYFSYPSLTILLFFLAPPIKTKTGTANRRETITNSKLHGSIRNKEHQSDPIYYTFHWAHVRFCCSAYCAKMLHQNHFAEPTQHVLTFLHPILICRITYWALVELL
jgi:hypothetical protein